MSTELRRPRWSRPLVGIAGVAILGAGLGAFFGIRAVQGAGSATSSGQPSARNGAAMAYDAADGSVILFGGQNRSRSLDDTWRWDGSAWTHAHPAASPPPLDNAQMTYDPVSHDLVLVGSQQIEGSNHGPVGCLGGSGSSSSGSSSGSSGSTATVIPPGNPIPAIAPAPSATPIPSGTAKPGRTVPMVPPDCGTIGSPSAVTWLWNGSDWSKASSSTPFVVFGSGTLATDPVSGRVLLLTRGPFAEPALGAAQPAIACPMQVIPDAPPKCPGLPMVAPAWTWNGHQWKELASNASTFDFVGSAIVDDAVTGKLASFGGDFIAPVPQPLPCHGCVARPPVKQSSCCTGTESIWNGTSWKQIATYKNGPSTYGVTFRGDPATHSDVLLTADGQTWLWTGVWTRVHPGTTPPIVSSAASAYDAATGQLVIFGGFGVTSRETGLYDQTWTWNGSDWTQRGGSSGPAVTIPVPSPVSIPPGPPCKPMGPPAVQPNTVCNGVTGVSSGSTGGATGVATGGGVVSP
jgi:Galactose oxidase, central domain